MNLIEQTRKSNKRAMACQINYERTAYLINELRTTEYLNGKSIIN